MDISALLQRVARGDRAAYAELVRRHQRPLFAYLGRMGLPAGRAEEVAQETFLRAWVHLPRFDPARAQFSTWLYAIARHLALHELERASHQREIPVGADEGGLLDLVAETSPAGDPAQRLDATRRAQQIRAALRELPTPDRSALALAYVHELSLADIARLEDCSVAAVKARLHRARQRLRERLGPLLEHDHAE